MRKATQTSGGARAAVSGGWRRAAGGGDYSRNQSSRRSYTYFLNVDLVQVPITKKRGVIAFVDGFNALMAGPSAGARTQRIQINLILWVYNH